MRATPTPPAWDKSMAGPPQTRPSRAERDRDPEQPHQYRHAEDGRCFIKPKPALHHPYDGGADADEKHGDGR